MLVAVRVLAMIGLLALTLPLHLLLSAVGRQSVLPPPFLGALGSIAGLRVRTFGRPAEGRLLLIANHTSWLDILALASASSCGFVARSDLAGNRVLKWLCEQNGSLFVAREQRGTVGAQVAEIRSALDERRMTVFPEGTTSGGASVLPFKSALLSAAEGAAVQVQPVALAYKEAAEIAWVGTEAGSANVLRMLARTRPVRLEVHFLPPLTGEERAGRKAMAAAAQLRIAQALGLSTGLSKTEPMP